MLSRISVSMNKSLSGIWIKFDKEEKVKLNFLEAFRSTRDLSMLSYVQSLGSLSSFKGKILVGTFLGGPMCVWSFSQTPLLLGQ